MDLQRTLSKRLKRRLIYAILSLVLGFKGYETHLERQPIGETISGVVLHVTDGDTLRMNGVKIRLWGVDAPEKEQRGFDQAGAILAAVAQLRMVDCRIRAYDRYDRLVTQCLRRSDRLDIGKAVIESGWAKDYPRYSQGFYAAAENSARKSHKGLWHKS